MVIGFIFKIVKYALVFAAGFMMGIRAVSNIADSTQNSDYESIDEKRRKLAGEVERTEE